MDHTDASSPRSIPGDGRALVDRRDPPWHPSPLDPHPHKPGPVPHGSVDIHIDLSRPLHGWATRQPEGVSARVRRLRTAEQRRRDGRGGATRKGPR